MKTTWQRFLPVAAVCVLVLARVSPVWSVACADETGRTSSFLDNGVTAHRGDSGSHPENTIPAFQSGIEVGADWLELDIFRTKDGEIVVTHDQSTARVGDMNLDVTEATYQQLCKIDVATDFRKRNENSLDECPPQRMPLLREVLELVIKQEKTRVSIQPKMACVPEAIKIIRELKAEPWCGFNDGSLELMSQVKELAPELIVFWDRRPDTDLADDMRIAKERGFEALVVHHTGLDAERVLKIKQAGFKAGAWTVNDAETMERLLDMGIDRIYTDFPGLLLSLNAKRSE